MHRIVEGIVLRETETKETDKILTVLTRTEGKLAVVARGARRRCTARCCPMRGMSRCEKEPYLLPEPRAPQGNDLSQ